jgi:hypothetical protein
MCDFDMKLPTASSLALMYGRDYRRTSIAGPDSTGAPNSINCAAAFGEVSGVYCVVRPPIGSRRGEVGLGVADGIGGAPVALGIGRAGIVVAGLVPAGPVALGIGVGAVSAGDPVAVPAGGTAVVFDPVGAGIAGGGVVEFGVVGSGNTGRGTVGGVFGVSGCSSGGSSPGGGCIGTLRGRPDAGGMLGTAGTIS